VIDLYQEQGYLRFREATDLRANAQQEYLERSRAYFDQEEALLRTALETVAKTADQRRQIEERLATLAAKRQRMEREAAQVTLERAIRSPFEALRDIQERASRAESEFKTREEQIRLLRESGAISELESLRRLATAREESARQLEQLAAEARAVAESAPGNERFAESMRQIAESARTAAAGAKELGQRAKEIAEPFTAGFQKGLKSFIEDAEAMGKQIESITSRAFNGMTDALTQFVMTGKLDFKSLANSIISDLIRIQIQRAITVPLANAMMGFFGFAGGGVMTSAGPMALRSYASGGVANSPQLALFGEGSRPEAYVPLPDGRSIPVTMSGGASGGDVFNISVSVSDAGASSRGDDPGGRDLGRAIASAVRQELLAQKRAGGLLDGRRAV
jgi:lambda family phage tail tape measure protein